MLTPDILMNRALRYAVDTNKLTIAALKTIPGPLKNKLQDLAIEMRRLRDDTLVMVRAEKQEAFDQAFKIAVNRMGPALRERLDVAITRIARVLNVKEKAEIKKPTKGEKVSPQEFADLMVKKIQQMQEMYGGGRGGIRIGG